MPCHISAAAVPCTTKLLQAKTRPIQDALLLMRSGIISTPMVVPRLAFGYRPTLQDLSPVAPRLPMLCNIICAPTALNGKNVEQLIIKDVR